MESNTELRKDNQSIDGDNRLCVEDDTRTMDHPQDQQNNLEENDNCYSVEKAQDEDKSTDNTLEMATSGIRTPVAENDTNLDQFETFNPEGSMVTTILNLSTQKSPSNYVTILKRPSIPSDVPLVTEPLLSNEICIEDCTVSNVNFKRGTESCIVIQVPENLDQDEGTSEAMEDQNTYDNEDPILKEYLIPKDQNKELENIQKDKLVRKNPKWVQMLGISAEDKMESTRSKLQRTRSNRGT